MLLSTIASLALVAGGLPVFVENRGQWDTPAVFLGRYDGLIARLEPGALVLQHFGDDARDGVVVRLEFPGSSADAVVQGGTLRPTRYSFFLGSDPACWQAGLPAYDDVVWNGLYPGIDLGIGGEAGRIVFDLRLAPGADMSAFHVRCVGATIAAMAEGAWLETPAGELALPRVTGSGAEWVFRPTGADTLRLEPVETISTPGSIAAEGPASKVRWSTYLGSTTNPFGLGDLLEGLYAAENGDVYVAGYAGGPNFPTSPGSYQQNTGLGGDAFVARLRGSDGALLFSAVVGGSGTQDRARAVAADRSGAAVMVGLTDSDDFPTSPGAIKREKPEIFADAFVVRVDGTGTRLIYSTYLGGTGNEQAWAVDMTPSGVAVVAGETSSADFPTTPGAFMAAIPSNSAGGFVTALSPSGQALQWSTVLEGSFGGSGISGLALGLSGDVTVTGRTSSADFPTTPGTWTPAGGSKPWGFVTRLNATGSALVWSTVFAGSKIDEPMAVAVEPSGGVVVAGRTNSKDFPTTPGALQPSHPGNPEEAFVIRLEPSGRFPIYSTYLPDASPAFLVLTQARGVVVDASGVATVAGPTGNSFVTTPGSFLPTPPGPQDGYVCRLDPSGSRLLYSSFVGGTGSDSLFGLGAFPTGTVVVGGATNGGYPVTPHAFDPTFNGGQQDAFVTVFDLLPTGVVSFGESVPACRGPLVAGVTEMPVSGSSTFALTCSGAPPFAKGWLELGQPGVSTPLEPMPRVLASADGDGWVETSFPLKAKMSGLVFDARFVFRATAACPGPERHSASNWLRVTVQ